MTPITRVLVVDQEPQIHRLIAVLLGDDYRVDGACNAADALAHIHDAPYDVVLVDEELPEVDGFDLLRKVRKLAPDLAVVFLTAQATVKSAVQAIRDGAFDY